MNQFKNLLRTLSTELNIHVDIDTLLPTDTLESCGIDSIGFMVLVVSLEEELSVLFDDTLLLAQPFSSITFSDVMNWFGIM